jgi:hypothetical protein
MSGLSWNSDSKNKPRDWEQYASAATAETGLVQMYRKKLLIACQPARALRKDLHDVFISWTTTRAQIPTSGRSGLQVLQRWEFADNIYVEEVEVEEPRTDFAKMRTEWEASQGPSKASKKKVAKLPKDSIDALLEKLKTNKYLHCSDPDASLGTLESLAAFAISVLGHVTR